MKEKSEKDVNKKIAFRQSLRQTFNRKPVFILLGLLVLILIALIIVYFVVIRK